jgi:DNA-binding HxlR family transcriptional regulator
MLKCIDAEWIGRVNMRKCNFAKKSSCPVDSFQHIISGKYKLRIIWDLQEGPKRYGQIKTGLLRGKVGTEEIAARVLSRELKALAEFGFINRKDFRVVPPKVEYTLTDLGKSLIPVIAAMHKWGTRHLILAPEQ